MVPASGVTAGVLALFIAAAALLGPWHGSTSQDFGWAVAGGAIVLIAIAILLHVAVPRHVRERTLSRATRIVIALLALPNVLVGIMYGPWVFGLPFFVAGTVGIALALGRSPREPFLASVAMASTFAAGFYWQGSLQGTTGGGHTLLAFALSTIGGIAASRLWRPPARRVMRPVNH